MQHILVMYSDPDAWTGMTPDQAQAFDASTTAYNDDLRQAGAWVSAEGFDQVARTVTFDERGASVADRPYNKEAEQPAGFSIIEAASLEEAVGWARKVPILVGAVEVRPLVS